MTFLASGFMLWKSNLKTSPRKYREITTACSSDVEAIKDVLETQQRLLQTLYGELDEERELSSSAANESMSMILRLQAGKAQLKMEARQYRREAEEKMCLAEESLTIFEDLLDQKEAEIADLEFQVQFYRDKLMDMGYTDLTIPEFDFSYDFDRKDVDVVMETDGTNPSDPNKSIGITKSSIPIVPKKVGASEHMKKSDGQVNTRMSRRPSRSCSVPPPDTQGSTLFSNIAISPAPIGV